MEQVTGEIKTSVWKKTGPRHRRQTLEHTITARDGQDSAKVPDTDPEFLGLLHRPIVERPVIAERSPPLALHLLSKAGNTGRRHLFGRWLPERLGDGIHASARWKKDKACASQQHTKAQANPLWAILYCCNAPPTGPPLDSLPRSASKRFKDALPIMASETRRRPSQQDVLVPEVRRRRLSSVPLALAGE